MGYKEGSIIKLRISGEIKNNAYMTFSTLSKLSS